MSHPLINNHRLPFAAICSNNHELPFHVVAYDFGAKRNILRMLVDRGCRLTIVPAQTSAEDVLKMNPDGIFLSNGPGDPAPHAWPDQYGAG